MPPAGVEKLRAAGIDVEIVADPATVDLRAKLADADAIIARTSPIPAALVAAAPRLRVVARYGVGYDNIDVPALTRRRIPLATIGDVNAVPVAEQTFALLLALARRVAAYDAAARGGRWKLRDSLTIWELAAKTIAIVGLGRIGKAVARRCLAFDMKVIAVDPAVSETAMAALGVRRVATLREALGQADIVTLHLPLSEATRNLLGAAEFAAMRPGSVLINAARGGIVDEAALAAALRSGHLAGAGVDVLAQEPPPADHPLLALDTVVISPHSAALTAECAIRMSLACAENVLGAFDGSLDRGRVVNPEVLA
ncbi:MAG: hydroxyacid dehydrogenase [Alphaproteobacteria bacterium]|nr:hydroxyacid dehydrogenase [Alphaproteobacteria bacterium]